jgi:hypothetical protein
MELLEFRNQTSSLLGAAENIDISLRLLDATYGKHKKIHRRKLDHRKYTVFNCILLF